MTAAEREYRRSVLATCVSHFLALCIGVLASLLVQAVLS
ncbi:hypothetical protein BurJV3_1437 [Stenotrophomonas maltophilia JV3]|nr:hypothetical protein BurJV3_1437 [Stenotrophomonas maltophilia JV3]